MAADFATSATLDSGILTRNLSALRRADPALADRIDSVRPKGIVPARTRDGHLNFLMPREAGRQAWFGRTSIPSVRAEAILSQFEAGNANVLLPGIGEGTEARLLIERLGPHRAVFIWEPDLLNIHLALQLHDFSEAILNERLILLACVAEALTCTLSEWLRQHEGHFCPQRLLMWPWDTLAGIAGCRAAVEQAYQQAESTRRHELERLRARMKPLLIHELPPQPALAVLALHAREQTWSLAQELVRAATQSGWPATPILVRSPANVHSLGRLRILADATPAPHMAILLDITRREVRDVLPESLPAICWLSSSGVLDSGSAAYLKPADVIAVTGPTQAKRVKQAGIDPRRVLVCPLPAIMPDTSPSSPAVARDLDVVVVADLQPLDPVSHGFGLPTHQQIWRAAVDWIKARLETFTTDQAGEALQQSEEKLGVRIDDPDAERGMEQVLGGPVAQTLLWLLLVDVLSAAQVRCVVFGDGWPERCRKQHSGPARTPMQKKTIAGRARMWIHADVNGEVSPEILTAGCCGAAILARRHPLDNTAGGLATMFDPGAQIIRFGTCAELIAELTPLLHDEGRRNRISASFAARCATEHTPRARLQSLRTALSSFLSSPVTLS